MHRSLPARTRSLVLLVTLLAAPGVPAVGSTPHGAPFPDCNGNGIEDAVDIALGASSDDDRDGVPDECQRRALAP